MKSVNNGTEGETLAFIILAQNTKRQQQRVLERIKPFYINQSGVLKLTQRGVVLLNNKQPCNIWKAHQFLSGLGYELTYFPENRNFIHYTHPLLPDGNVVKTIRFVDRLNYINHQNRRVIATFIKHEVIKWTQ